jgi:hypothetical protein
MDISSQKQRWTLYEFLDPRGQGIIEGWVRQERLQKDARARLNAKLDLLEQSGPDLSSGLLAGTKERHIYKLRVKAPKLQLRPLLCRGPLAPDAEFTLLLGAIERNNKLPDNALTQAAAHREIIIQTRNRRRLHEHPF